MKWIGMIIAAILWLVIVLSGISWFWLYFGFWIWISNNIFYALFAAILPLLIFAWIYLPDEWKDFKTALFSIVIHTNFKKRWIKTRILSRRVKRKLQFR
jgi:hypothetical protein